MFFFTIGEYFFSLGDELINMCFWLDSDSSLSILHDSFISFPILWFFLAGFASNSKDLIPAKYGKYFFILLIDLILDIGPKLHSFVPNLIPGHKFIGRIGVEPFPFLPDLDDKLLYERRPMIVILLDLTLFVWNFITHNKCTNLTITSF